MGYNETLQEFGARRLETYKRLDKGSIDRSTVRVDTGVAYGGYCETCQYETSCLDIYGTTVGGKFISIKDESYYTLADLLEAIFDIEAELK